jgi:hypothetical protein
MDNTKGGDIERAEILKVCHLLNLPIFAHLVERIEVVLQLACIHLVLGVVRRVLVEVREEDSLRVRRLDMFAGTAVAVAVGADFVVEAAVDFVLFGAEDGGEVVCHGVYVWRWWLYGIFMGKDTRM